MKSQVCQLPITDSSVVARYGIVVTLCRDGRMKYMAKTVCIFMVWFFLVVFIDVQPLIAAGSCECTGEYNHLYGPSTVCFAGGTGAI